ncbi:MULTISPECIES: 30S ribosome-binding factor RbfA [Glutamicibacter]|jgi:ribosome-binding factor A|uniref:Ribosome-binding factor A n=2 Tax=Glutamicibacter arilaitensis TaxID=256701 RepID=A0A2N7S5Y4_9MICC|nr:MULTISPECIES: 30S ribosome-binding factor RbfA [Glutamicibacter]PMQ21548.1 30S ribosome-binding factor RbfA [Glutamicibacter arilaitensis]TFH55123.1 30S ribosome-binding factor RbfA [Glutamicibacter arilaitensis]CBT75237.1 ribosome-binding factor A [Glutamicibacter arilaitensis Re117]HCJ53717.1 30S ribosome-binding factor RbfA [Glutamicibacter sp.]HCM93664.1 30S ribosome-binding factor RbfA [Glutamicibacter sp.]
MADSARAARLAKRVQVLMAQSLRTVIKDERIDNVTVTDARVTNDLQHATVYYTVFGDDEMKKDIATMLEKRGGALRKELGRNLTIRLTPTLAFVADEIPEGASHLEELLAKAREKDAEVAALREGKDFAGDQDPYKKDEDAEEA